MEIKRDGHNTNKTVTQNNFYLKGKIFCGVNKLTDDEYMKNTKVIESCKKTLNRLNYEEERRK